MWEKSSSSSIKNKTSEIWHQVMKINSLNFQQKNFFFPDLIFNFIYLPQTLEKLLIVGSFLCKFGPKISGHQSRSCRVFAFGLVNRCVGSTFFILFFFSFLIHWRCLSASLSVDVAHQWPTVLLPGPLFALGLPLSPSSLPLYSRVTEKAGIRARGGRDW